MSSNVLDTSDGVLVSIVFRDISERVRIQSELVSAKEQAEKASQAKSMFLSNISHELRTPLNGVLGYAQLLLADKNIPDRYLGNLKLLEECGLHLLTLINDILDLTKIESGGVELDPQPYDLRATLNTVLANVRETAASKKLELKLDVDPDIALELQGDNVKIRQVLINLLGNAVKFTDYGVVGLQVYRQSDRLCFEVRDTGIGIAEEDRDSLFKPFSQLNSGRKQGGTGLGLAISYRLVKAMGGELQVDSCLHKGSMFFFAIPYRAVSQQPNNVVAIPVMTKDTATLSLEQNNQNVLILIVDDCFNNRNMLVNALRGRGYQVESAEDGREAIEMCRKTQYDLILMDIRMPKVDGITATRTIHQIPEYRTVQVIAISASVSDNARHEIKEAGFCEFIAKPVHLDTLFERITYHLNTERSELDSQQRSELIHSLRAALDLGDVETLLRDAQLWQDKGYCQGTVSRIINNCKTLDMQALEQVLQELEVS